MPKSSSSAKIKKKSVSKVSNKPATKERRDSTSRIAVMLQSILAPNLPSPSTCLHPHPGTITIGSACSGWSSELFSLDRLGVKYTSCFACDNNPQVKALSQSLHKHHFWYDDATSLDFIASPTVDLFFAGFPCQPFSKAGANLGLTDDRGIVVLHLVRWLGLHKPKVFLFENVKGLWDQHKATLLLILELLCGLTCARGRKLYQVSWKILNCRLHGGLPQNRERLFIAGVRKDVLTSEMAWPEEAVLSFFRMATYNCRSPFV